MTGIIEKWHSERPKVVKTGGAGWLENIISLENGAISNNLGHCNDYMGNVRSGNGLATAVNLGRIAGQSAAAFIGKG
jgi:hypothetical protein